MIERRSGMRRATAREVWAMRFSLRLLLRSPRFWLWTWRVKI